MTSKHFHLPTISLARLVSTHDVVFRHFPMVTHTGIISSVWYYQEVTSFQKLIMANTQIYTHMLKVMKMAKPISVMLWYQVSHVENKLNCSGVITKQHDLMEFESCRIGHSLYLQCHVCHKAGWFFTCFRKSTLHSVISTDTKN